MNWGKEIEIDGNEGSKVMATLADIESALLAWLTKDEQEEFVEDLIRGMG